LLNDENSGGESNLGPSSPRRLTKTYIGLILLFIVTLTSVGYALTTLTIQNTGSVNLLKDWQGITVSPPGSLPTCSSQSPYSDTPPPMLWGSMTQGTSETGYICVKNAGGTGATYTVTTSTLTPSTGITVTYNGTSTLTSTALQSSQTSLIVVSVSAALTVPSGSSFSYTTTIQ